MVDVQYDVHNMHSYYDSAFWSLLQYVNMYAYDRPPILIKGCRHTCHDVCIKSNDILMIGNWVVHVLYCIDQSSMRTRSDPQW